MRCSFSFVAAFLSFIFQAQVGFAQTSEGEINLEKGLPVYVECNFRVTNKVSCNDFVQAFFSSNEVLRRENSSASAVVSLSLTDEKIDSQLVNYSFTWKLAKETNHSDFVTTGKLNQTTSDSVFMLNALVKGANDTVTYLADFIKSHGGNDDQDPNTNEQESIFDRLGKSPLYISMGGNGSYKASGSKPYDATTSEFSLHGGFGYIQNRYKFGARGYYNRNKSVVPTGVGYLTSQTTMLEVDGIFLYSMTENRRWNVAVIQSESVDKNSNIDLSSKTQLGFEWILVPFRTTENKELAFRVGVGQNFLKLGEQNMRGNISENYMSAFAKIYFFWVLKDSKITLKANAGINQNLGMSGYERFNLGGSINYQVSKSVRLSLDGNYSYSRKSLTYPSSPDLSNPLLVQQMSGQVGKRLGMTVGISYTIGNTLRKNRDRRWAD
jgi:hypothetical protein